MHVRVILGVGKGSHLVRCPQFRGVLIAGFHCIHIACTDPMSVM